MRTSENTVQPVRWWQSTKKERKENLAAFMGERV